MLQTGTFPTHFSLSFDPTGLGGRPLTFPVQFPLNIFLSILVSQVPEALTVEVGMSASDRGHSRSSFAQAVLSQAHSLTVV